MNGFKADAFCFITLISWRQDADVTRICPLVGAAVLPPFCVFLIWAQYKKNHIVNGEFPLRATVLSRKTPKIHWKIVSTEIFTKILEQNNVLGIASQFLLAFIYICELSHLFLFDRHIS